LGCTNHGQLLGHQGLKLSLTGSFRGAAELAGCSHHRSLSRSRAKTAPPDLGGAEPRPTPIDDVLPKLEESVERSRVRIRADVVD